LRDKGVPVAPLLDRRLLAVCRNSTAPALQPESDESAPVKITVHVQDEYGSPLHLSSTLMFAVDELGEVPEESGRWAQSYTRILPGNYCLVAVKESYTADFQYVAISEQSNDITFMLGEGGAIYGTAVEPSEKKLSVLPLGIWELLGRLSGIREIECSLHPLGIAIAQDAQINKNTEFVVPHLPGGWYVVMSDSAASDPVEVRAGHETGPIHLAPMILPDTNQR
jgi:hypothetical protein